MFDRVKGSKAYDVDGNEYVDYIGSWGPAIVGHADDRVLDSLKKTLEKGTSFGAPCALENELARMVIDAVPSVDMIRFTNSGTEACMGVLRLMRAYTGREKVSRPPHQQWPRSIADHPFGTAFYSSPGCSSHVTPLRR